MKMRTLTPWKIGDLYKKVRYIAELPAGTAAATGTQVVDILVHQSANEVRENG